MTDVEVHDNPDESRFEAYVDGGSPASRPTCSRDGTITFIHTEVDDAYEGQGVGSALVRQVARPGPGAPGDPR